MTIAGLLLLLVVVVVIVLGKSWLLRRLLFRRGYWRQSSTCCLLFDVLSVRRARAHHMVVFDETMIFLVSAKTPLCHKVMDDHILQSRHETKDAGELETFLEEFVGLCWLGGPNCLISMLYLSYLM